MLAILVSHCHQFFRCGGVDTHGGVKLVLGKPGFYRDCKALDNFRGICTDNMYSNDSLTVTGHNQFHQCSFFPARQGVFHRPEFGAVHIDRAVM